MVVLRVSVVVVGSLMVFVILMLIIVICWVFLMLFD